MLGATSDGRPCRDSRPLIGCGFPAESQVRFNGVVHSDFTFVDSSHIRVGLSATDVATPGFIVVTLSTKDKDKETEYGHGVITVSAPTISWHFPGIPSFQISQELQLLLLVLFSGALGSSVYAMKSLADYRGAGKLYGSWYSFYFIQPFEGAGIALIFYFAVRGGFLAGTGADVKAVNPLACAQSPRWPEPFRTWGSRNYAKSSKPCSSPRMIARAKSRRPRSRRQPCRTRL